MRLALVVFLAASLKAAPAPAPISENSRSSWTRASAIASMLHSLVHAAIARIEPEGDMPVAGQRPLPARRYRSVEQARRLAPPPEARKKAADAPAAAALPLEPLAVRPVGNP